MLDECGGVTVLATSREPLGLPVETVWPVPPLSVPPENAGLAEALEHDAGRLFAERGARALPGLQSPGGGCRGPGADLPSARRYPARDRARGRTRQGARSGGDRRAARRSLPTARAAMTRHYRSASERCGRSWTGATSCWTPAERLLLARLSLFAGGFELDAVESVCPGDGVRDDELSTCSAASWTRRSSRVGRAGAARASACTRRSASTPGAPRGRGRPEGLRARHLDWCRTLAAAADDAWLGEGGPAWLDRARAEQDNVRQALRWGLQSGRGEEALGLAWRFANFWSHWGRARRRAPGSSAASRRPTGPRRRWTGPEPSPARAASPGSAAAPSGAGPVRGGPRDRDEDRRPGPPGRGAALVGRPGSRPGPTRRCAALRRGRAERDRAVGRPRAHPLAG